MKNNYWNLSSCQEHLTTPDIGESFISFGFGEIEEADGSLLLGSLGKVRERSSEFLVFRQGRCFEK